VRFFFFEFERMISSRSMLISFADLTAMGLGAPPRGNPKLPRKFHARNL